MWWYDFLWLNSVANFSRTSLFNFSSRHEELIFHSLKAWEYHNNFINKTRREKKISNEIPRRKVISSILAIDWSIWMWLMLSSFRTKILHWLCFLHRQLKVLVDFYKNTTFSNLHLIFNNSFWVIRFIF